MIPSMIYNMGSGILRAVGDSKRPLLFLVVCTLVNTVLDLFFVGVLRMEVKGAAIATSLSQLICAVLVIYTLRRRSDSCRLVMEKHSFDWALLGRFTASRTSLSRRRSTRSVPTPSPRGRRSGSSTASSGPSPALSASPS